MPSKRSKAKARNGAPSGQKQKKKRKGMFPGLSSTVGSALGGFALGPAGAALGARAGDWFGRITGLGDYKVNRNTLLTGGVPVFNSGKNFTEVTHREYIGDVVSGTAGTFDIQSYTINPSNPQTFPWLSGSAQSYESYEMTGMIFEFKSLSGTAVGSTNTALGAVTMATVYDVEAPPFTDRRSMEQYEYSVSARTTENLIHPVECDPKQNVLPMLFTRTADGTNIRDKRFHDMGEFYIATDGLQASNVTIGELWVSYRVRLFKPRARSESGGIHRSGCLDIPAGSRFNPASYAVDPYLNSLSVEFANATTMRLRGPASYLLYAEGCVDAGVGTIANNISWTASTGSVLGKDYWPRRLTTPTSSNLYSTKVLASTYATAGAVINITGAEGLVTLPQFALTTATLHDVVYTVSSLHSYTDPVNYNYGPYPFPALVLSAAEKELAKTKLKLAEMTVLLETVSLDKNLWDDLGDIKSRSLR